MKGKRYTTEDKIRLLREGDRGKSILEVCRAHNIPATANGASRRFYASRGMGGGQASRPAATTC